MHVYKPEGSIGKEGPSAGTAILSAFVSLFTQKGVNPDIGEFFFGSIEDSDRLLTSYEFSQFLASRSCAGFLPK